MQWAEESKRMQSWDHSYLSSDHYTQELNRLGRYGGDDKDVGG